MSAPRSFPGIGFDPAPGCVPVLEVMARSLTDTSARLGEATRLLEAVARTESAWTGEAAEAFATCIGELPIIAQRAGRSYGAVGRALAGYAAAVEGLQREVRLVEADALDARQRVEGAGRQIDLARQRVAAAASALRSTDGPSARAADRAVRDAAEAHRLASAPRAAAGDDLHRAIMRARSMADRHRAAADRVVAAIVAAGDLAPPEPGALQRLNGLAVAAVQARLAGFDDLVTRYASAITLVADVSGALAAGLGLLSLMPGLQALAFPSLGLSIVALLGHASLAATGNSGWTPAALDATGVASFGVGAALGRAVADAENATGEARSALTSMRVGEGLARATGPRVARAARSVRAETFAAMMDAEQSAMNRGAALTQQKLTDATLNAGNLAGFATSFPDNAPTYRRGLRQIRQLVGAGLRSFQDLQPAMARS